jgi:predicted RNA binding protein with dsRBD fold (UPF0201 family)
MRSNFKPYNNAEGMSAVVNILCPINPTEDPEKVKKAVLNIFPDADIEIAEGELKAGTKSLERFKEILREQRIRYSARAFLSANIHGNSIIFSISKQAAYMGKISFGGLNQALGEIEITIEDENPKNLVEWLTEVRD